MEAVVPKMLIETILVAKSPSLIHIYRLTQRAFLCWCKGKLHLDSRMKDNSLWRQANSLRSVFCDDPRHLILANPYAKRILRRDKLIFLPVIDCFICWDLPLVLQVPTLDSFRFIKKIPIKDLYITTLLWLLHDIDFICCYESYIIG